MKLFKKAPTSFIVVVIVSTVLLLVDIGLGIFFSVYSTSSINDMVKNKIMEHAYTAAALLDNHEAGSLTQEDKINKTERYQYIYNTLYSFKTSGENTNGELAYVYLLVQQGDKIVFSVDPSDDPGEFLVEEPIYTQAMKEAFTGIAGTDSEPYTDRWGRLYSGYAPVYDGEGENRQVVAVVGIDLWADFIDRQIISDTLAVVSISTITILLGVGVSLIITFSMRRKVKLLSNDLESLENDVQQLVQDIETPLSAVDTEREMVMKGEADDPMLNIRNKLSNLSSELKRYMAYAQEQASVDRLTHLANRNAYSTVIKDINDQIKSGELKDLVVAVYDVNGLKAVNDSTGHEVGDKLLKITANIVQNVYGKDNCFRIGGDEIVIVFHGSIEEFNIKNDECNKKMDEFNNQNTELPFVISLSVGYDSYIVGQDKELLDVFRRADKNMYRNKDSYYQKLGVREKR